MNFSLEDARNEEILLIFFDYFLHSEHEVCNGVVKMATFPSSASKVFGVRWFVHMLVINDTDEREGVLTRSRHPLAISITMVGEIFFPRD